MESEPIRCSARNGPQFVNATTASETQNNTSFAKAVDQKLVTIDPTRLKACSGGFGRRPWST